MGKNYKEDICIERGRGHNLDSDSKRFRFGVLVGYIMPKRGS